MVDDRWSGSQSNSIKCKNFVKKTRPFDCCHGNQKSNNLEIKDQVHQIFLETAFIYFQKFFYFFFPAVNTLIRTLIHHS